MAQVTNNANFLIYSGQNLTLTQVNFYLYAMKTVESINIHESPRNTYLYSSGWQQERPNRPTSLSASGFSAPRLIALRKSSAKVLFTTIDVTAVAMGQSDKSTSAHIPSWQRSEQSDSSSPPKSESETTDFVLPNESRDSLLEQATKFLEDEGIQHASLDRKRVFLVSKGLNEDDVTRLLSQHEQEHTIAPEAEVMEDYGIEKEVAQFQSSHDNTTRAVPPSIQSQEPASQSGPPIITYPEFLVHSQKPPPFITANRLLTSLYAISAVAAATYGLSKYIVEPMVEELTSARHALAETATTHLDTLNAKLSGAVSRIPEASNVLVDDDGSNADSVDSDAAHLFSRSAGTQTSPQHSRATSLNSTTSISPVPPVQLHDEALSSIQTRLSDVYENTKAGNPVRESVDDLKKYLEELPRTYSKPQSGRHWEKPQADEYSKMKAEIRTIKGVLLSARNFPSGVAAR